MIDTHCHLTDPRLFEQLDGVIARAASAGVSRIITIGTDLEDDRRCIALCQGRSNVRCAVGIHPNHCKDVPAGEVEKLREMAAAPEVLALGEMGMDYFHDFAPRDQQERIFQAQLQLATEIDMPVVIHSREAVDDCLAIMRGFPKVRAVFHSFTGTTDEARRIIDAGHLIGFTGPVTYKKNETLREVARMVPGDRIFVETDAPYLSPEPVRKQKPNEPALMVHTAAVVAREKGMSLDQFDQVTTDNARRFFRWE